MSDDREHAFFTWVVAIPPGHSNEPGVAASDTARDMDTAIAAMSAALRTAPGAAVGAITRIPTGVHLTHDHAGTVIAIGRYNEPTDTVDLVERNALSAPDDDEPA